MAGEMEAAVLYGKEDVRIERVDVPVAADGRDRDPRACGPYLRNRF